MNIKMKLESTNLQSIDECVIPLLSDDEVFVLNLSVDQKSIFSEQSLSIDEKKRAAAFRFEKDRVIYIASKVILRELLGRYFCIDSAQISFKYSKYRKPLLDNTNNSHNLFFNISHSKQMILFAFSKEHEIGVDVEWNKNEVNFIKLANDFFTSQEANEINQADNPKQHFYKTWTCKEAFIKAKGLGLSYPLKDFELSVDHQNNVKLLRVKDKAEEINQWALFSFAVSEDYTGALAVRRERTDYQSPHP